MDKLRKIDYSFNRQLHKFGGSSLADISCYKRVANIIREYSNPGDIIVVSASGNTTNQLIDLSIKTKSKCFSAFNVQSDLYQYHKKLIHSLLLPVSSKNIFSYFKNDFICILNMLKEKITDISYAKIVSYGEIWSARLMAAFLNQCYIKSDWINACDFLFAERCIQPKIDVQRSKKFFKLLFSKNFGKILVITGFICRNKSGETVLLGRNGSDYTATQIGELANVSEVTIWSDVAGIYSADPRKVQNAHLLPVVQLNEAFEIARLATSVLHVRTLQPISSNKINLVFRCSYDPNKGSTRIERSSNFFKRVTVIINHDNVCLIELIVPQQKKFNLFFKEINFFLEETEMKPLAFHVCYKTGMLQLCYTNEIAKDMFHVLKKQSFHVKIQLRKNLSLIGLIGSNITKSPLHYYCFFQHMKNQPIEFFWQSKNQMSLIAVLRFGSTDHLVREFHSLFFLKKNRIFLVFFKKSKSNKIF